MLPTTVSLIQIVVPAMILGAIATFAVRFLARRYGFIARPKSDRWHKRPTAMLGGVSIFLTTTVIFLTLVPATDGAWVLMGGSSFMFLVGLVDDSIGIRPYQKLIGQFIASGFLIQQGLTLPITGHEIVDIWITLFWLVGITNAVNLLDNMDGLAAGIAAIAAISLAADFGVNGNIAEMYLLAGFIGALLGFLIFNFNPASIFMGDCGSMFIGFFLAGSVLLNQTGGRSRGILPIIAVPVLILFVPIFDTTLVTVIRKLWGRGVSQGGRDHTSHRLVALGLGERSAVLMLYLFAAGAGVLALMVSRLDVSVSLALISFFSIVLVLIGVYLSRVKVYEGADEERAVKDNAMFAFLVNVSHKRRIFEVFLDAFLVTLAYYSAFLLILGPFDSEQNWELFLKSLPILIFLKLGSFLVVGVYRGLWRYTSIGDFVTFTKGVLMGSFLSVLALLLLYRFEYFSRAVFVVDGLLLLLALIGSRMAFRLIRRLIPMPVAAGGKNVLIYGAGDGGEMVLRELQNNPEWLCVPVGFIDDDPLKKDKLIHGLKVYGGDGSIADVCRDKDVGEILISTRDIGPDRLRSVRDTCRDIDVSLKRARIVIEPVEIE